MHSSVERPSSSWKVASSILTLPNVFVEVSLSKTLNPRCCSVAAQEGFQWRTGQRMNFHTEGLIEHLKKWIPHSVLSPRQSRRSKSTTVCRSQSDYTGPPSTMHTSEGVVTSSHALSPSDPPETRGTTATKKQGVIPLLWGHRASCPVKGGGPRVYLKLKEEVSKAQAKSLPPHGPYAHTINLLPEMGY